MKNKTKNICDNRKSYQLWTLLNQVKGAGLGGPYIYQNTFAEPFHLFHYLCPELLMVFSLFFILLSFAIISIVIVDDYSHVLSSRPLRPSSRSRLSLSLRQDRPRLEGHRRRKYGSSDTNICNILPRPQITRWLQNTARTTTHVLAAASTRDAASVPSTTWRRTLASADVARTNTGRLERATDYCNHEWVGCSLSSDSNATCPMSIFFFLFWNQISYSGKISRQFIVLFHVFRFFLPLTTVFVIENKQDC